MTLYEILKARKTGLSPDLFTSLISKKHKPPKRKYVSVTGIPPLQLISSAGANLVEWLIEGDTVQKGEPSPENPVDVKGVGDRTGNLFDLRKAENDRWLQIDGSSAYVHGYYLSDYIKIESNISYHFDYRATTRTMFYDENKSVINAGTWGTPFAGAGNQVTPSNAKYVRISISGLENAEKFMLCKTDEYTGQYEPYGVKIPVVSRGKNLFDEQYKKGYYSSTGAWNNADNQICTANHIPVKPNSQYWLGVSFKQRGNLGISMYDRDKNFIEREGSSGYIGDGVLYTTKSNVYFIKINFMPYYGDSYNNDIIIADSTIQVAYEPYRQPITTTQYLPTPLMANERLTPTAREVKWIKQTVQIGSLVTLDNGLIGGVTKNFDYRGSEADTSRGTFYCDRCTFSSRRIENTFYVNRWNAVFVGNSDSTLQEFKEKYDGAVLIYPLATPTTEPIETTPVGTLDGECWIDVDTEVEPPYMETTYVTNADDSAEINGQSEGKKEVIEDEHQFSESGTGSFE